MQTYSVAGCTLNSVELKCLLVSKGVKVDKNVYAACGAAGRVNINPLTCNCLLLPDGTVCQMTDVSFHMDYLAGSLSWSNLKLMRYASQLYTPFRIRLCGGVPMLLHEKEEVCPVSFPAENRILRQKDVRAACPLSATPCCRGWTGWRSSACGRANMRWRESPVSSAFPARIFRPARPKKGRCR